MFTIVTTTLALCFVICFVWFTNLFYFAVVCDPVMGDNGKLVRLCLMLVCCINFCLFTSVIFCSNVPKIPVWKMFWDQDQLELISEKQAR